MKGFLNVIRDFYTGIFAMTVFLLSIYALLQIVRGTPPALSWLGLFFSAISPLSFLVSYRFLKIRKHENPIVFSLLCGMGVAICMTASSKYGNAAGSTHIWAGLCLVAWVLYLRLLRGKTAGNPSSSP
jgi:hypothetical protein